MTKRARLLARVHGIDANGTVWATEGERSFPVYNVSNVPDDYKTMLAAAPLMFRAIDLALPMIDTVTRIFEARHMDDHVMPLMQLEAGLNVALLAALNGAKNYSR